tara:strand:+ start:430 stop:939 length:510 start_codon:yes stop_codon:yes gene_type:complete
MSGIIGEHSTKSGVIGVLKAPLIESHGSGGTVTIKVHDGGSSYLTSQVHQMLGSQESGNRNRWFLSNNGRIQSTINTVGQSGVFLGGSAAYMGVMHFICGVSMDTADTRFFDTIITAFNSLGTVTSHTSDGSPASRTYSATAGNNIQLTMGGSDDYLVENCEINLYPLA